MVNIRLRLDAQVHRDLKSMAAYKGKTLHEYIVYILSSGDYRYDPPEKRRAPRRA